ncbi:oligopeptide/dipeptide ABC transporter ATP-binding protein [Paenirhodobacter populi]|uniref:ABC transporter ATP-binding protein n=1 Tax=Paenirhodobacter populi TaxID=2306993 RepID=A0A443IT52_9RHOB|nr:ABC transporter ATP-binding protein [Sinirhodobacter populi]RWR10954.1 ABC transporter ATP-binding protein [Sinirhodobacter populi]
MSIAIELTDIGVEFPVGRDWRGRVKSWAHALNGVSLRIARDRTLGILGESGCGKSTLAQVMTGLLAPSTGAISGVSGAERISIVLQDPNSSLDPRMPIWRIVMEPVFLKQTRTREDLRREATALLVKVGLRPEHIDRYPHEFSGGQRQRIAIARALSSAPEIIILDEPTSALDVSVQAQILNLLRDLQREHRLAYVFISHNVSVIRHFCDEVAVMYLGQIVEQGPSAKVFAMPAHPYTRLLLDAVPKIGRGRSTGQLDETELPSNRILPAGCFFRSRCRFAGAGCEKPQPLRLLEGNHKLRCHKDLPAEA